MKDSTSGETKDKDLVVYLAQMMVDYLEIHLDYNWVEQMGESMVDLWAHLMVEWLVEYSDLMMAVKKVDYWVVS